MPCAGCTKVEVVNALGYLVHGGMLPVQAASDSNPLHDTLAAMVALALRAQLPRDVINSRPDALLALLWTVELFARCAWLMYVPIRGCWPVVARGQRLSRSRACTHFAHMLCRHESM